VKQERSLAAAALSVAITFYRRFISPALPPMCRFKPTCSEYALEAIRLHGAGRGSLLAAKRLLRCHPFTWLGGSSGFDPVPPPRHHVH
jgi:putative membrane protein insertion efficiency factor